MFKSFSKVTTIYPKIVLLSILSTALAACSSNGSGSDSESSSTGSKGIPEITITPLPNNSQQFYENQTVIISLNTQGANLDQVTYVWKVDAGISFQGQNTDTITFTAPPIDGNRSLSISVDIGLKEGTLFGNDRLYGSVMILDTDPPSILRNGFKTTMPPTSEFDFAIFSSSGIWRTTEFLREDTSPISPTGLSGFAERIDQQVGWITRNESAELLIKNCGQSTNDSVANFLNRTSANELNCSPESFSQKRYQDGENLRLENLCNGKIVQAKNFEKISADASKSLGNITFTNDTFELIKDSSNVCAQKTFVNEVDFDSTIKGPLKFAVKDYSNFVLYVPQNDGYLNFIFDFDTIADGVNIFNLGTFFTQSSTNKVTLQSDELSKLNGKKTSAGDVVVTNFMSDDYEYNFDFDLDFQDEQGIIETIQGEASFNLR